MTKSTDGDNEGEKEEEAEAEDNLDDKEQIKILGLDLGQACVFRVSALLPRDNQHIGVCDITMEEPCEPGTDIETEEPSDPSTDIELKEPCGGATPTPATVMYYNLAVKQKAIYQPTFKHRCRMEEQ